MIELHVFIENNFILSAVIHGIENVAEDRCIEVMLSVRQ